MWRWNFCGKRATRIESNDGCGLSLLGGGEERRRGRVSVTTITSCSNVLTVLSVVNAVGTLIVSASCSTPNLQFTQIYHLGSAALSNNSLK